MGARCCCGVKVSMSYVPVAERTPKIPLWFKVRRFLLCGYDPIMDELNKMVQNVDLSKQQELSCDEMFRLTTYDPYMVEAGTKGACIMVLELLQQWPDDEMVLMASIRTMGKFATNQLNSEILRTNGAVALVQRVLKKFSDNDALLEDGRVFLRNMMDAGVAIATEALEHAIAYDDATSMAFYLAEHPLKLPVVRLAIQGLEKVARLDGVPGDLVERGRISSIVDVLRDHKKYPDIVHRTTNVLFFLAKDDVLSGELGKCGAVKNILALMDEFMDNKEADLMQLLLFTLKSLCTNYSNCKRFVRAGGKGVLLDVRFRIDNKMYSRVVVIPLLLTRLLRNKEIVAEVEKEGELESGDTSRRGSGARRKSSAKARRGSGVIINVGPASGGGGGGGGGEGGDRKAAPEGEDEDVPAPRPRYPNDVVHEVKEYEIVEKDDRFHTPIKKTIRQLLMKDDERKRRPLGMKKNIHDTYTYD